MNLKEELNDCFDAYSKGPQALQNWRDSYVEKHHLENLLEKAKTNFSSLFIEENSDPDNTNSPAETLFLRAEEELGEDKYTDAIDSLKEAAKLGHVPAMKELGSIFAGYRWLDSPDLNQAKHWYQKASEHNCHESYMELGFLFMNEGDIPRAIEHYQKSTELGNFVAPYALAKYFYETENFEEAIKYCKIAIERGHPSADKLLKEIVH
jgi:TPR repeat protein